MVGIWLPAFNVEPASNHAKHFLSCSQTRFTNNRRLWKASQELSNSGQLTPFKKLFVDGCRGSDSTTNQRPLNGFVPNGLTSDGTDGATDYSIFDDLLVTCRQCKGDSHCKCGQDYFAQFFSPEC